MPGGWASRIIAVLAALALIARRDRLVVSALAVAFVVPPVGLWTLGQVTPAFIDRYVICSALALVALAGAGLAALRDRLGHAGGSAGWGRLVAFGVLAGLVVLGGQRVARIEAAPVKVDNAPAVIRFLQAHAETGDAIAYAGGGLRTVLDASLPHGTSLPLDVALAPHGQASFQHDLYAREVDAPALRARLATVERLWLITDPGDQQYPRGGPFAQLEPLVLATFGPGRQHLLRHHRRDAVGPPALTAGWLSPPGPDGPVGFFPPRTERYRYPHRRGHLARDGTGEDIDANDIP